MHWTNLTQVRVMQTDGRPEMFRVWQEAHRHLSLYDVRTSYLTVYVHIYVYTWKDNDLLFM